MYEKMVQNVNLSVFFIDSLRVYDYKYYLQVYLDNRAYKIVDNQMIYYLDDDLLRQMNISFFGFDKWIL